MAQAPDPGGGGRSGGAGAPRLNRTIKQFSGMNTREFRNAVPEGAFPWLENIQPIGPGNLHSIPGRGQAVSLIPPLPPAPARLHRLNATRSATPCRRTPVYQQRRSRRQYSDELELHFADRGSLHACRRRGVRGRQHDLFRSLLPTQSF